MFLKRASVIALSVLIVMFLAACGSSTTSGSGPYGGGSNNPPATPPPTTGGNSSSAVIQTATATVKGQSKMVLSEHYDQLDRLAHALLEHEQLDRAAFEQLVRV